jgi:hypothetical protein
LYQVSIDLIYKELLKIKNKAQKRTTEQLCHFLTFPTLGPR